MQCLGDYASDVIYNVTVMTSLLSGEFSVVGRSTLTDVVMSIWHVSHVLLFCAMSADLLQMR